VPSTYLFTPPKLFRFAGSKDRTNRCTVATTIGTHLSITCALESGQHEVKFFGTILVNSR